MTEETNQIATTGPTALAAPAPSVVLDDDGHDAVLVAHTPAEMRVANEYLVAWCDRKIDALSKEAADLTENIAIAAKRKWATTPLERARNRVAKQVTFYEKIRAAVQAGYCILPDFPIDVFAIRTSRQAPRENLTRGHGSGSQPNVQETNAPDIGEGVYVSPTARTKSRTLPNPAATSQTPEWQKKITERWAAAFQDADFPFKLAKPRILEATDRAMALNVFDELGVLPARPQADPMVIGRIVCRDGSARWQRKTLSFLVTWFLDTRDL